MRTCKYIFLSLLFVCSFGLTQSATAQRGPVNKYSSKSFSGSFSSISSASSANFTFGNDDGYASLTLPFDFWFDSVKYSSGSTIYLITNGWVSFTNSASGCCSDRVGDPSYPNSALIYSTDLVVDANVAYYKTTGVAPNRVFTMELNTYHAYLQSATSSMQIILYETTNVIEMVFADHGKSMGGGNAGQGLNGGDPSSNFQRFGSSSSTTPNNDIRWTPPPLPPPPSQLSLSPKTINFGSLISGQADTFCITAKSLGPSNLLVGGPALSGNPDFSLLPGGTRAGDSILVGNTTTYCIRFAPIASGTRTSTFTLSTNGRDSGTQSVSLVGQGIAPGAQYVGSSLFRKTPVRVGDTSQPQYFYIKSTGTGALTVNSVTVIGLNPNSYFISHFPASSIPTGQMDSVGVTFVPKFEGRPDASIAVSTNALNQPYDTVRLFGNGIVPRLAVTSPTGTSTLRFDSVAVGDSACQTVMLSNPGSDTVRITRQLKSSGDFDFYFYPLTGSDTAIAPSQSKSFNVCFVPLKNGTRQATYRFYTTIPRTFPGGVDTSQIVLNVVGVGVPTGRLSFSGARIDTEVIGTKGCQNITITNIGQSDITVDSSTISGLNASEFTTDLGKNVVIVAGGSKVVNVCFTPTARSIRNAQVTVFGRSGGRSQTITVPLAGVGLQQCASAAPMSLFSTPTLVGSTDTAVVTVTNCGDVATTYTTNLTGTGYTVTPATSGAVAPGGTAKFVVHYTPTTLTNNAGTLVVNGGAGITPMTVTLGGSGGGVALSTTGNAGQVPKGNCKNFDIAVTNTGNVAWTPNGGSISGANGADFTIVSSPSSVGANGGTGTITIKFCPTTVGSESANLNYTGTPMPLSGGTIVLSGSGVVNAVSSPVVDRGYELDQSYPNPAKSVADVRFVLPTEAVVHITLMDATGATVRTATNERFSGGEHAITIDTHDLASGTYFYVLSSNGVQLTKQMTVVK